MTSPFDTTLDRLHATRHSAKWSVFDPDVLPAWVAEMDVSLAPPIAARLHQAVTDSDTGYAGNNLAARTAFAGFAGRRWDWEVDVELVRPFADVGVAVTEVLRRLTRPGDGVLINTPVYPSFFAWFAALGVRPVEVPLLDLASGGRLDLEGMERALAEGVKVVLLCSPHNPTGRIHTRVELATLASLAARYDAVVLADEIHAPLVHPGETFTPYLTVSAEARATGLAFHSASKAWNLAGLKCAFAVAATPERFPADLSEELSWAVGHFGLLAAQVAWADGGSWLDEVRGALADNARLTGTLLAEQLPEAGYHPPAASFLAWLDLRRLDLGEDPAAAALEQGRVALQSGPSFGAPGKGWARLNIGTSSAILTEAIRRLSLTKK